MHCACHNTLQCIGIQNPQFLKLSQSRYTQYIATQCLKPTSGHNTPLCIVIQSSPSQTPLSQYNTSYCDTIVFFFQAKPTLSLSQYNEVYCDTLLQPKPLLLQYTWCIVIHSPCNPLHHVAIQFPAKLPPLSQYNGCIVTHSTAYFTPKTCCVTIQFPIVL